MTVTPRPALLGVVAGAVVLHLLARITGTGWMAFGSAALLGLGVAAVLARPRLEALEVTASAPRVGVGGDVDVVLRVRNRGRRGTPSVVLEHRAAGLTDAAVVVPALAPGAVVEAPVRRTALARASTAASRATLQGTDAFGLLAARREVDVGGELVVHPVPVPPRRLPEGGAGGAAEVPVAGHGVEVLGLRPWRPGDAARDVHARASARHGRPVVLEREREAEPRLAVALATAGSGPAWEAAVARAAGLALAAALEGRPVAVVGGPQAPRRLDRTALLDWFSGLETGPPAEPRAAAAAAGAAGTLVVLGDGAGRIRSAARAAGVEVVEVRPGG